MPMFCKKPVVIEARQMPGHPFIIPQDETFMALADWCGATFSRDTIGPCLIIPTLEGDHRASIGDWIIKGVKGEFYPCKPDIFAMTYEAAES